MKRFEYNWTQEGVEMIEEENGQWVRWSDVEEALEAEREVKTFHEWLETDDGQLALSHAGSGFEPTLTLEEAWVAAQRAAIGDRENRIRNVLLATAKTIHEEEMKRDREASTPKIVTDMEPFKSTTTAP